VTRDSLLCLNWMFIGSCLSVGRNNTSPIETSSITSASGEIRSFLAALVGGIGVWGPMTILEAAATPLL
jgi:hypothetical protein